MNAPVSSFVYSNKDLSENLYTIFSTTAKDTSVVNYLGADKTGDNKIKIGVREDGSLSVHAANIQGDISNVSGSGNYDKTNRIITLDYTYVKGTEKHNVIV